MCHSRINTAFVLLLLLCPLSVHSSNLKTIRFSCSVNENSDHFRYFTELYTHAFKQLGYKFQMKSLPPLRELAQLRERKIDGVCARTDGILATTDTASLIRVNEVVVKSHMVIYGRDPTIKISPANLQTLQQYQVGYRGGYLGLADSLKNAGLSRLQAIELPVHGVRQLAHGRIDLYIDQHVAIVSALEQHPDIEKRIHNLGSYKKRKAFAYIIPRHKGLAPDLVEALKVSKKSIPLPKLSLPIDD